MAKGRISLGRGLGALLSEIEEAYENDIRENKATSIEEIELGLIEPNPFQPRKEFKQELIVELANSIRAHGLLQPILLIKNNEKYLIVAGERRFRATQLAGYSTIKAVVAEYDLGKLRELALIENIQREDLNPIELAVSYQQLMNEYKITQDELSTIVLKSRSQVANTLRLLNLDDSVQKLIAENKLSAGHAKALLGVDKEFQGKIVSNILKDGLSVRDTEEMVRNSKNKVDKKIKIDNPKIDDFGAFFAHHGIKTKIKDNHLSIDFSDESNVKNMLILIEKSR